MKPIIKLYLKTFILMALPYYLILSLFDLGDESELTFVIRTLTFGLFMSLTLVSIHWYKLNQAGVENLTDENVRVNQTRVIETELNVNELVEKLKLDLVFGKLKWKESDNGVSATTGFSIYSWGEEIRILVKSNKEDSYEYQVSSRSKLQTTIVDFGKNLANVNKIELIIKNIN
jgi:hypothetical protein